jgi:hypothetical protein
VPGVAPEGAAQLVVAMPTRRTHEVNDEGGCCMAIGREQRLALVTCASLKPNIDNVLADSAALGLGDIEQTAEVLDAGSFRSCSADTTRPCDADPATILAS